MTQTRSLLSLLLAWGMAAGTLAAAPPPGVQFLDTDLPTVRKVASEAGKLYFIHFTAAWCMPCQWMDKHTFSSEELASYAAAHYLALRADVDAPAGKAYKAQFDVATLPATLIFNSQGVLVQRHEGSLDAAGFLALLQENNLPAHRINKQLASAGTATPQPVALDSPKPRLNIYRPALLPEAPAQASTSAVAAVAAEGRVHVAPAQNPVFASPTAGLTMTARSAPDGYTVVTGTFDSYDEAVRAVRQLEEKFTEPVRLRSSQNGSSTVYTVSLGHFKLRSKASEFLNYLNRKDLVGEVQPVSGGL